MTYYAFDVLYLNGYDLRDVPLIKRKELLRQLIRGARVQYLDHIDGDGPEFLRQCCRIGLEGVISKLRERPYRPGRNTDWLKSKCLQQENFVIGGFTDPAKSRKGFGAIAVGYFDEKGRLKYAGRVGSGFTTETLIDLRKRFDAMRQTQCPFDSPPREIAKARWVRPELVAQVEYIAWTGDEVLRNPVYQGDRPRLLPCRQRSCAIGIAPQRSLGRLL